MPEVTVEVGARLASVIQATKAGALPVRTLTLGTSGHLQSFRNLDVAVASGNAVLPDGSRREVAATGKGASLEARMWSALMEVCERVAILEAQADFAGTFRAGSEAGLPLVGHPTGAVDVSDDVPYAWSIATRLKDGQSVYISRAVRGGLSGHFGTTSSGAAAGQSMFDAMERGLLELVERDAFMVTWISRREAPQLSRPWDPLSEELRDWLHEHGMSAELRLLRSDLGLPVVLAVARQTSSGGPFIRGAVLIGCSCSGSLPHACSEALLEVVQAFETRLLSDTSALDAWPEGMRKFLEADRSAELAFLGEAICDPDQVSQVNRPIEHVQRSGWEVYSIDRSAPALRSLGLAVVETVVPGLQPLIMKLPAGAGLLLKARFDSLEALMPQVPHPLG